MLVLQDLDLKRDGLRYIKACLGGWDGLAKRALDIPLSNGNVLALLPSASSLESARNFAAGGLQTGDRPTEWLVDRCMSRASMNEFSSLIFFDTVAKSSDKNISASTESKFFHKSMVYYFINSPDFSIEKLKDVIYASRGFSILGFYISSMIDKANVMNKEVDEKFILDIGCNIVEIYAGAYDQESFVIWTS